MGCYKPWNLYQNAGCTARVNHVCILFCCGCWYVQLHLPRILYLLYIHQQAVRPTLASLLCHSARSCWQSQVGQHGVHVSAAVLTPPGGAAGGGDDFTILLHGLATVMHTSICRQHGNNHATGSFSDYTYFLFMASGKHIFT